MFTQVALQGKRRYMEDRAMVIDNFHGGYGLYIVCDGHGGDYVADFCMMHLPRVLRALLVSGMTPDKALGLTFVQLDDQVEWTHSYMTGTTCIVLLKHTDHFWIAHVGDSRAILNTGSSCVCLTKDHKPIGTEKDRIDRIEEGVVIKVGDIWRVNGELAVSRAIGDKRLRPYVIPEPEVRRYEIPATSRFVVMATDGLWDVMSCNQVNEMVMHTYLAAHNDIMTSDREVVETAGAVVRKYINPIIEDNTLLIILHIRR